ncbi:MAG: hypothetical protein ABH836_07330 [Candidatus Omnitrophota bacterium]
MIKRYKKFLTELLMVVFLASSSGCASYRVHPDFKERQKSIYSVAVLPPEIDVYKLSFRGDKDPMYDVIALATNQSKDEIEKIFKEKGYVVQRLDLSENRLQQDSELRSALYNIRELYKKTLDDICKRRQKKFTYSVGADINQFADLANADVIVMLQSEGYKKTGGEIAKDIAKSILVLAATCGGFCMCSYYSAAIMNLSIIDGNTGDVLWYNNNKAQQGIDMAKEKHVRNTIKSLLKAFPDSAFKVDKKGKR